VRRRIKVAILNGARDAQPFIFFINTSVNTATHCFMGADWTTCLRSFRLSGWQVHPGRFNRIGRSYFASSRRLP
jgi:hypothetical protein